MVSASEAAPARRPPVELLPSVVLVAAAAIIWFRAARNALAFIAETCFEGDAWTWVYQASQSWSSLLDYERNAGNERIRPVTHFVFWAYVRWVGLDARWLGYFFFVVLLLVFFFYFLLVRRLGLRAEIALLAATLLFLSPAVPGAFYMLQYNDLVLADFFTLAAILLCLRPQGASAFVVVPLALLAVGSHESGAMCGPLLVLAHLYRDGVRQLRTWALRPATVAVLAISVVYSLVRVFGFRASRAGLVGTQKIGANLRWLQELVLNDLRHRHGALSRLFEQPSWVIPLALLAFLAVCAAVPRVRAELPALLKLAVLAPAWLLTAYAPFLLNVRYQAGTYAILALMIPVLLIAAPLGWVLFPPRPSPRGAAHAGVSSVVSVLRAVAVAAGMVFVVAPPEAFAWEHAQRFTRTIIAAVAEQLPADRSACFDVWLAADPRDGATDGPTQVMTSIGGGMSLMTFFPGRPIRLRPVSAAIARYLRLRSRDVLLVVHSTDSPGSGGRMRQIWLPHADGAELLLGLNDAGPPARVTTGEPLPEPLTARDGTPLPPADADAVRAVLGGFWTAYAACNALEQCNAITTLRRFFGNEWESTPQSPAWLQAIYQASPMCGR